MKKILIFALLAIIGSGFANAAMRDNTSANRSQNSAVTTGAQRSANNTGVAKERTTSRTATTAARGTTVRETAIITQPTQSRSASARTSANQSKSNSTSSTRSAVAIRGQATNNKSSVARATDTSASSTITETRTGMEYEQCKTSYFACMDQFCQLKNDNFRRCSCSDRVYNLDDVRGVIQDAGDKLTVFTEGLDTVGLTAEQATAMRTASEGENALTADGSASKALLQAIMNSIRGADATVGGKFSELNSINISFDTANAFGITDSGQAIAAYNGKNLYTAIYSQCRAAVRPDCNDASLQRAVTAYLMAIEQDCNTVQTSINENQKKMIAAVREGNALLDLARIENRQKHNSDDMTECLGNVEKAILSEEVCGAGYHKCLDNGEFIDISTGAPIVGVVKFYELEHLLKFDENASIAEQKLSKTSSNRMFVQNFEKRVKKFAEPALDKCVENASAVWSDYLDKAMLDIYYAQKAKVAEIKQGCFDFVSTCYMNGDNALTKAMQELVGDPGIVLQPDRITLNDKVCEEYVGSCNNMFDGDIVKQYVENRKQTDTLAACRAVVKQCFDKFGGSTYENFYYPYSGLITEGKAADWFTLCADHECTSYKSECAKQLSQIASCADKEMMEKAFGGFDYECNVDSNGNVVTTECDYGLLKESELAQYNQEVNQRALRPSGVATEVYYQIIDILKTQCTNVQGRFVELQFLKTDSYNPDNICTSNFNDPNSYYNSLTSIYGISAGEDMCPRGYKDTVDIKSWGACNCWENGARRSKWGKSVKCIEGLPTNTTANDASCASFTQGTSNVNGADNWCTQTIQSSTRKQICPWGATIDPYQNRCKWNGTNWETDTDRIPRGS